MHQDFFVDLPSGTLTNVAIEHGPLISIDSGFTHDAMVIVHGKL